MDSVNQPTPHETHEAARNALLSEGYLKDDFDVYEEYTAPKKVEMEGVGEEKEWKHGNGVLVFAKARV
ncbi:hypothetical protein HYALB_00002453 [Hymenoscyphus albidus]|uniref:Uncharacterized protein n=1 Tax=Hymenoscyphus albidus TaxID=595503 RepID=A0A9N9LVS8_9HELO|nr:hypothetical protein HYALB_00002453 [Hymenoscyphus albidus]